MKHIAAVLGQPVRQSWPVGSHNSTAGDASTPIDSELVEYVFNRMQSGYGQMWSSRITSTEIFKVMVVDWGMSLVPFTVETIDKALARCEVDHPKCPTKSEFIAQCRASRRPRIDRALPRPRADGDRAASALAGLRRALAGQS